MSSENKTTERFKQNLVTLLDIIVDMFEEASENNVADVETNLVEVLKIIVKSTPGSMMMGNFIKKTNEYWDKIYEEDLEYFKNLGLELFNFTKDKGVDNIKKEYEGNAFFNVLKDKHIDNFKTVLAASYESDGETVEILDSERREDIWKILKSFVRMSIVHVHEERKHDGSAYTKSFFPSIKIKENVERWQIKTIKL